MDIKTFLKPVETRPTVAGIVIRAYRNPNLSWEICTHVPTAGVRAGFPDQRTLVGGRIKGAERPIQAMQRKLGEEYGVGFARFCQIEPANICPTIDFEPRRGGLPKMYWWFWIGAILDVEPDKNDADVHSIIWEDCTRLEKVYPRMSNYKAGMLKFLISNN